MSNAHTAGFTRPVIKKALQVANQICDAHQRTAEKVYTIRADSHKNKSLIPLSLIGDCSHQLRQHDITTTKARQLDSNLVNNYWHSLFCCMASWVLPAIKYFEELLLRAGF